MADASVSFLLENVKQLLSNHITLIGNADNELNELINELDVMKAALEEASKRRNKNKVFEKWEEKIRETVYTVEDTIDSCITQTSHEKGRNIVRRGLNPKTISLAQEVKTLRTNKVKPLFNEIQTSLLNLGDDAEKSEANKEPQIVDKRKKNPREDNVVGFEDETDKLIGYLNEESDKLEVISIVGMPGLGKTTVAWKICKDSRIQYEFPTIIWVYVSQTLNKKDVFLTILKKFTQQDLSSKDVEQLGEMVKEYLERGKFLIFMDDVWTREAWNEIKEVLPLKSNRFGKVLITTRDENVAYHANSRRDPHQLRFLRADESWQLLQLEVYGQIETLDKDLERVGKVIAEKCKGLPLAIIVIGGILVDKIAIARGSTPLMRRAWEKVSTSVDTHLMNEDKEKLIDNIISMSYAKLPYDLRDCFLYLGMFPEDTEIPAWRLIRLWTAEGFIQKQSGKTLEETALDNLKDLINRNLVMVDKTQTDGEVKTCRVHDTIREFCKKEAFLKNKNLFQEVKLCNGVFEPPTEKLEKYRRLCVHSHVRDFFTKKPKVPKARSFLCFSNASVFLDNKEIAYVIEAFSLLRVLDASNIKFPKYPLKVTQLIHLRFLTLSDDKLKSLPESLSKLWNLQTLLVNTLSRTLEVDADIGKMVNFRHFKTKASIILKRLDGQVEGGENLQMLSRILPESCTDYVFKKVKNLNTLGIRGDLSRLLAPNISMENLELLNKLKLVHDVFPNVASEVPLSNLPQQNKFPQNIKTLMLSGTYLKWARMSTLAMLGTLEVLQLKDNAFMGNSWDVSGGGFVGLEFLHIERTDLKFWDASDDAFPKLKGLVLKSCEKLEAVPFVLHKTLITLSLERVTAFAVSSAKRIEKAVKDEHNQKKTRRQGLKLLIAPGDQTPN